MQGKGKNQQNVEELLQNIDISGCMNITYDAIVLGKLLNVMQLNYNIPLQSIFCFYVDRQISYYLPDGKLFVTCGVYPLGEDVTVQLKDMQP